MPPGWKPINQSAPDLALSIDGAIRSLETQNPHLIRNAPARLDSLWIGSDYSGQHKGAAFDTYAFTIAPTDTLQKWNRERARLRAELLPDGRRISYKDLREPMRRRALPAFLNAADSIAGTLIVFSVDQAIGSLFGLDGNVDSDELQELFDPQTPRGVIERSLRIALFGSTVIAGIRRRDQVATWISDNDEMFGSNRRTVRLLKVLSHMADAFCDGDNRTPIDFCTTSDLNEDRRFEDFVSLSDLAAGAVADLAIRIRNAPSPDTRCSLLSHSRIVDSRTRSILNWFANTDSELSKFWIRVFPEPDGSLRARAEQMHAIRVVGSPSSVMHLY